MSDIRQGDYVLLYYSISKRWLVKVDKDKQFHTHLGVIDLNSMIGKPYGIAITTNKGKRIYALKPLIYDFIMKSERKTQIVYPKDLGYIAVKSGISNGSMVLEIGTGSGALTMLLANLVKPDGHVYTYDINAEFSNVARRNLAKAGLDSYVTFNVKDISNERLEIKFDLIVIDLGDPCNVIDFIKDALKPSRMIFAVCPTINQAERLASKLRQGFVDVECVEILLRNIEAREGMSRPSFRMIAHTAYLVSARRVLE